MERLSQSTTFTTYSLMAMLLIPIAPSFADETSDPQPPVQVFSSSNIAAYARLPSPEERRKRTCRRILHGLVITGGFAATGLLGWSEFSKRGGEVFWDDNKIYYGGSAGESLAAVIAAENSPHPYRKGWARDRKLKAALKAVNSSDPVAQAKGMRALDDIDSLVYTKYLIDPHKRIRLLSDTLKTQGFVARSAAEELGRLRDTAALPALRDVFKNAREYVELKRTAEALIQIESASVVSPAKDALKNPTGPAAIAAVGRRKPSVISALKNVIKNDWYVPTRIHAAEALARMGDPAGIAVLKDVVKNDVTGSTRSDAARAIAQLGDPSLIPTLKEVMEEDGNSEVRRSAARALGQMGDPAGIAVLKDMMKNAKLWLHRVEAAEVLARKGNAFAIPALKDMMKNDSDPFARGFAVRMMGQMGDPSEILSLREVMQNDTDASVRTHAVLTIGRMGDMSVIPAIKDIMRNHSDFSFRISAVKVLGRMGDPSVIPALEDTMKYDRETYVRKSAAEVLGRRGYASAIPVLKDMMRNDGDPIVREHAAKLLGQQGDPSVIPALKDTWKNDTSWSAQVSAARALAILEGKEKPDPKEDDE